jgi:hypothetical protein
MDERYQTPRRPERREKRNLVDILDYTVVIAVAQMSRVVTLREKRIRMPGPDAMDLDSVECRTRCRAAPPAAEQVHDVTLRRDPAERLA